MSLKILLAVLLGFSALPAFAQTVSLGGDGKASVEASDDEGATVTFTLPGGKRQVDDGVGDEIVPFLFEGKSKTLAVADLDKDGDQEVIVRATIPPRSGALVVYRWNSGAKKFDHMMFGDDDYLGVDLAAEVRVSKNGDIRFRAIVHDEDGSNMETRDWKLQNGKYVQD